MERTNWWRVVGGVLILLLVFGVLQLPDGRLHLIFCDVGQGDASLIVKGDVQILIDTGPKNGGVMACLAKHMPFWDRKIEVVVNSHPAADHFGDFMAIATHYKVGEVIVSDENPVGKDAEMAYQLIKDEKIKKIISASGDSIRYGSLQIDTLWPGKDGDVLGSSTDDNARALVMRMRYPGLSAMFTSDMGVDQESVILDEGILEQVDVLKVAHHGSRYSSSLAFDEVVKPKWAVVSVGAENTYGHPAAEILERFQALGAKIWRTDRQGELEFVVK